MQHLIAIILFVFSSMPAASSIFLDQHDAVVWHFRQTVSGRVTIDEASSVLIYHGEHIYRIPVREGIFNASIDLHDGVNKLWVATGVRGNFIISDTLILTLGYRPVPQVLPLAAVAGDQITLKPKVLENPRAESLLFEWEPHENNPAPCRVVAGDDSVMVVRIPDISGVYSFRLRVITPRDTLQFRTFAERDGTMLRAFNIETDHPEWAKGTVIYQLMPSTFVDNGTFSDIRDKLPELQKLGITTLLLQPIFPAHRWGQGYDVVDYLSVRSSLGTKEDFRELVNAIHAHGMRVLLDMVPNHTSIHHPYAIDFRIRGSASHYASFYQQSFDDAPYSSFYNRDTTGFIYYFWKDLVNLNYGNEEVQRWMIEICTYWVREYAIDGYRFDAVWGVNARMPSFGRKLRLALKSINPDVFMLAEDKPVSSVYNLGFDAAYDWTADTTWVSQWSWEHTYDPLKSHTIFNHADILKRASLLRSSLGASNEGELRVRFMENNDLHRFITGHTLEQTKQVAALLFALPGIPMLYQGQEAGYQGHPYRSRAVFRRDMPMIAHDSMGLFDYYQRLIRLRKEFAVMENGELHLMDVAVDASSVVAFRRKSVRDEIVVVLNLGERPTLVTIPWQQKKGARVIDLLSGKVIARIRRGADTLHLRLPTGGIYWLRYK